jgi:uncharacterized protein (TIGR00251 family)
VALEIAATRDGSRLKLRVKPGARRACLEGEHGGALRVAVTAPPEKGKANDDVVKLLAGALGLPRSAVRIVAGLGSRDKSLAVDGVAPDEVRRRLAAAVGAETV